MSSVTNALIIDAVRSPIGKRNGTLSSIRGDELCGQVLNGLLARHDLEPGEIESTGGGVRGVAVHIGGRVAALAGASEVLVSQTVKDLVAGSGLVFEDEGEHELKGIPDRWRLYRVVSSSAEQLVGPAST